MQFDRYLVDVSLVDPRVLPNEPMPAEDGFEFGHELKELAGLAPELGRPVYLKLLPEENRVQVNTVRVKYTPSTEESTDVPPFCLFLSMHSDSRHRSSSAIAGSPPIRPVMLRSVTPWLEQRYVRVMTFPVAAFSFTCAHT
jgi:hypothetical protein